MAEQMKEMREQVKEIRKKKGKDSKGPNISGNKEVTTAVKNTAVKRTKNKTTVLKRKKAKTNDSDSDVENTPCLYCNGRYLESNEGWASCAACGKWAHCSCAGIEDEDEDATFTCELCLG
ncbi:unnamed protein product [Colias eurytheme]|nr:unnamed protein product [Colias eurytheme]